MPRTLLLLLTLLLPACQSYTTPGGPADFSKLGLTPQAKAALTDASVQTILNKKPLLTFPAAIAAARVQASDYTSYYQTRAGRVGITTGAYAVITLRDIETDDDFNALAALPQISGIAGIKRILLTDTLNSDLELRNAAAKLHANLLLLYTFDTAFHTDTHVRPLTLLSLGIAPNKTANVTSTASAILMDVNNGYIYAVLESTASNNQLANAWTSEEAMDQVRQKTERQAFTDLLSQFKSEWPKVVATYTPHPTTTPR